MLPFMPINTRDNKLNNRGNANMNNIFLNSSSTGTSTGTSTGSSTSFPIFDQSLFSLGGQKQEKEHKNIDRGFLSQRNYEQETSERLNGFSIIPRDTRNDTTKKTVQIVNQISNRTTGIPFSKIID